MIVDGRRRLTLSDFTRCGKARNDGQVGHGERFSTPQRVLKSALLFLFIAPLGYRAEAEAPASLPSPAKIAEYENIVRQASPGQDRAKIQSAADSLRLFYTQQKQFSRLQQLHLQLTDKLGRDYRRTQLFEMLQELDRIAVNTGELPPETRNRLGMMISLLEEYRWYERDLSRALSYIAIGRCYFLLKNYHLALAALESDKALFDELDRNFRTKSRHSPKATLLLLRAHVYQKMADAEKEQNSRMKLLAAALETYFIFIRDYPDSVSARDALSRYELCRVSFEASSQHSIRSLHGTVLANIPPETDIPPNIRLLIGTGNHQTALDALMRELNGMASPPVAYLCAIAECQAHLKSAAECRKTLNRLTRENRRSDEIAGTLLRCAALLKEKYPGDSEYLYGIFLENYRQDSRCATVYWALAEISRLEAIKTNRDFREKAATAIDFYTKAIQKSDAPEPKPYLFAGRGSCHAMLKNHRAALADFRQADAATPNHPVIRKNLAASLYDAAVADSPPAEDLLREANALLQQMNPDPAQSPEMVRLRAQICETLGNKKEAAEILGRLLNASGEMNDQTLRDLIKASALLHESGNEVAAKALMEKISRFRTRDMVRAQFQIGEDLLRQGKRGAACKYFELVLQNEKDISIKELQYLVEHLYQAGGESAKAALHTAFRAGKMLESRSAQMPSREQMDNLRLKTATAAMRLGNHPTAIAMCDLVLKNKHPALYIQAKTIKAENYRAMRDYRQARFELTDLALAAARSGESGIYLKAKLKTAEILAESGQPLQAIMVLENILAPVITDESIKPDALPEIYRSVFAMMLDLSERTQYQKREAYSISYRRLFPPQPNRTKDHQP